MSSILKEIQQWATSQPAWQQEAAVRLFEKGELTPADDLDLYALLKGAHGISDPENRTARNFSADLVAPVPVVAKRIELTAIANLRNVNALAEGKTLSIAPKGITVIYGDNGTGKSGYARVLKHACRARDQREPILPDANRPVATIGKAEATFTVRIDGVEQPPLAWTDGEIAPEELAVLSVFDAHCARHYLDDQGDQAYSPYGMDILRGLSEACDRLRLLLSKEIASTVASTTAFQHLKVQGTSVGDALEKLSGMTSPTSIEQLATLAPEEITEHESLAKAVNEPNPKEKANLLRLRAHRLVDLAQRCTRRCDEVSETVMVDLKGKIAASRVARTVADLAAKQFKSTPGQLPETGSEVWVALFEASRDFALKAYPGKIFPALGPDSPCPLCQQTLGDEAAARLVAFDAFIQAHAEKTARAKRAEATSAYVKVRDAVFAVGFDAALRSELTAIDPGLSGDVDGLEAKLLARRAAIIDACIENGDWGKVPAMPASPADALNATAKTATTEANALDQVADDTKAKEAKARFQSLDARRALYAVRQSVLDAIATMKKRGQLFACESDVQTAGITTKVNNLNKDILTKTLENALNQEFVALGVHELQVSLRSFGQKGETVHKLVLQKPSSSQPTAILSEGEQRAVAIAAFLADINIVPGSGGIIFDDPVSSLDHLRRWRVVARLVAEAKKRQVIVLTHDLYFLFLLQQEAVQNGVAHAVRSLSRTAEGFGVAVDGVPFDGATTKARVKLLREAQGNAAMLWKQNDQAGAAKMIRDTYVDLRKAWERGVEEVLFAGTVFRFTEGVSTQRLAGVEVSDDDYKAIDAAMTRCSKFAHDGASAAQVPTPHPDELLNDIENLEAWRLATEKRRETLRKHRGG